MSIKYEKEKYLSVPTYQLIKLLSEGIRDLCNKEEHHPLI
jgi:hypothetical protein